MKRPLCQLRYISILLFVLLSGCASKKPLSPMIWNQMENTVTNQSFKFVAYPPEIAKSEEKSADTSPGYLVMEGDSVQTYLGFYRSGRKDRNDQDIRGLFFEGEATNIEKIKHLSRQFYELRFNLIQPGVLFECRLRVFPDYSGLLTIYNVRQEDKIRRNLILKYGGEIQSTY